MKPSARAAKNSQILKQLQSVYADAHCELNYQNPYELLIATILSAQCTDVRVNQVTQYLFAKYPRVQDLARASAEEVEAIIRPTGFFKNKAKNIIACCQKMMDRFAGQVPQQLEELVSLDGVGRKTANVVLGNAFGITSGIVVDTHVMRLSQRFGWARSEDPVQIEKDLQKFVPPKDWIQISHQLIFHGRRVCKARNPQCSTCFLFDLCPRKNVK